MSKGEVYTFESPVVPLTPEQEAMAKELVRTREERVKEVFRMAREEVEKREMELPTKGLGSKLTDIAVAMVDNVIRNRNSYLEAWLAATGIDPSEAVLVERTSHCPGGIRLEVEVVRKEDLTGDCDIEELMDQLNRELDNAKAARERAVKDCAQINRENLALQRKLDEYVAQCQALRNENELLRQQAWKTTGGL